MFGRKVWLRIFINSLLGLALIYLWTRFVNPSEVVAALKQTQLGYILLLGVVFCLPTLCRAIRLKVLLSRYELNFKELYMLNFLSQLLSFMIPVRAGEITKGVYLSNRTKEPFSKTLIWVLIDRFIDFWAIVALIALGLGVLPAKIPFSTITLAGFGVLVSSLILIFLLKNQESFHKIIVFLSNLLIFRSIKRMFISVLTSVIDGVSILHLGLIQLLIVGSVTLLSYVFDGLFWWLVFRSLGVQIEVPTALMGNLLMALTFILPSAPGFVGSAEAAGLAVFSGVMGIDSTLASAATVLFHILVVAFMLILGTSSLYFLKFDLNVVWEKLLRR